MHEACDHTSIKSIDARPRPSLPVDVLGVVIVESTVYAFSILKGPSSG